MIISVEKFEGTWTTLLNANYRRLPVQQGLTSIFSVSRKSAPLWMRKFGFLLLLLFSGSWENLRLKESVCKLFYLKPPNLSFFLFFNKMGIWAFLHSPSSDGLAWTASHT